MAKQIWKPGNMLYPLPAVMVSVADKEGNPNIITVAWAGTVCTNPPMVSISVRPERYSYHMIDETLSRMQRIIAVCVREKMWTNSKSCI